MTVMTAGPITVDTRDRDRTSLRGRPVALTKVEHRLLVTLVSRPARTLSRDWLYQNVWKDQPKSDTRAVDKTVSRLRAKLGSAAPLIQTIRGVGYCFGDPRPRR